MMQDDQYDDKRLMWMKEDLHHEHIMHTNQMIPYEMGPRHPLELTDLSNNMLDGKMVNEMNDMHMADMAGKKKRGRPKKVRGEGEEVVKKPTVKRPKPIPQDFNGEMPQKKRGRPKKGQMDGSDVSPRPPKTPQSYNGDMPKKKRGRPKKGKGDKDDGMLQSNEMSQGGGNDSRTPNEYMASLYSSTASVNTCSSHAQHQPLRLYDQSPANKFGGNYFGLGGSPNTSLNNSAGNYSQNYHSQHQYAHSDLSTDISAAISTAEHLGATDDVNSPASASPNLGPSNFEQTSGLISGSSTPPNRMPHQMQQTNSNICYSPYRSTPPSNEYLHMQQQAPAPPPSHSRQSSHTEALNEGYLTTQSSSQMTSHQLSEAYSQASGQHHPYHHSHGPPPPLLRQPSGALNDIYNSKMLNTSDVTSKSLSGLESLVDQIPSLSTYNNDTGNTTSNTIDEHNLNDIRNVIDNPINEMSQIAGGEQQSQQQESQSQYENNCVYSTAYSPACSGGAQGCPIISNSPEIGGGNNSRSRSSEGGSATPNSNLSMANDFRCNTIPSLVLHQKCGAPCTPSPMNIQANSANASPSAQTPPGNANSYSSLCSPFSVSSLTATANQHSYTPTGSPTSSAVTMSSYHSNLMAAATIPPSLYMEPHIPMAVNPLYHHPHHAYSQHHPSYDDAKFDGRNLRPPNLASYLPPTGAYGSMAHHLQYQQQQHQLQEQSLSGSGLLHMPSPNYPYGYAGNSPMGYHQHSAAAAAAAAASNHHSPHASYLGHHSLFDRIKPDIGGFNG